MITTGHIRGIIAAYEIPIRYSLSIGDEKIGLNEWIGENIRLTYKQEIRCHACGRITKKSFNSGYCFPCFKSLPENDLCIVKPHECHYELGTCRDSSFGDTHCMVPHYVYLALSSGVKVGLTRKTNVPKRWIDQGAVQAIPIAELPTRKMAGELEFALSQVLPDKTNWRKMLKGDLEIADLFEVLRSVQPHVPESFRRYMLEETELLEFIYPIAEEIGKITSFSFDKEEVIEGRLIGIKGQYVLLDNGVINVRKHTGYKISIECTTAATADQVS